MLLQISSVKFMSKSLWGQNQYITAWGLRSIGQWSSPDESLLFQTHSSLEAKPVEVISPPLGFLPFSYPTQKLNFSKPLLGHPGFAWAAFPSFSLIHDFTSVCYSLDLNWSLKEPWLGPRWHYWEAMKSLRGRTWWSSSDMWGCTLKEEQYPPSYFFPGFWYGWLCSATTPVMRFCLVPRAKQWGQSIMSQNQQNYLATSENLLSWYSNWYRHSNQGGC